MNEQRQARRHFLGTTLATAGIILSAGGAYADNEKETNATEDLMREHGVLRRALLVYQTCASRLRGKQQTGLATTLTDTAKLFRTFGEDYHERAIEEKYIFPMLRKVHGHVSSYPDILTEQHNRGRQLTDYVISVTRSGTIPSGSVEPLAKALGAFVVMYAHHAAREDTDVFTAWKSALSDKSFKEMSQTFDDIEKRMFGHDGFEDAVKKISAVENHLGMSNLAQFTMHDIPKA